MELYEEVLIVQNKCYKDSFASLQMLTDLSPLCKVKVKYYVPTKDKSNDILDVDGEIYVSADIG